MNISKFEIVIFLTTVLSINLVASSSNYTCSLDDMKLFALEACENIFKSFEDTDEQDNRDKREIWNTKYNTNGIGDSKDQHPKASFGNEMVKVRRKDYPEGGFIRINRNHAKILTQNNNDYKILHRKFHNKSFSDDKQYRYKRNVDLRVPYCCLHNCRIDFFCKR